MSLGLLVLVGGLAAVLVFIYASSHWRQALFAVLILVIFEGALRKWVFPQARDLLYFLKDALLIPVYLTILWHRVRGYPVQVPEVLKLLLTLNVIWGVIQAFNPALGSPLVGLLGLRAYLLYIPLMFLLPNLFPDQAALLRFLRIYLLLVIPLGILGIIQYFSDPQSPINHYVLGDDSNITNISGHARITGTFSYIAGYATYLTVTFALLLPFMFVPQTRLWRVLTLVEMVLIIANSLMTGSRGVIVAQILILLGFLLIHATQRPAAFLKLTAQLALPAIILTLSLYGWFQPAIETFMLRVNGGDSVAARISASLLRPAGLIHHAGIAGYGIGATQGGANSLRQVFQLPSPEPILVGLEVETDRVLMELGPFGFITWYGLRLYLLWQFWRMFRALQTPLLRHLAAVGLLTTGVHITAQLVTNPTFLLYYWFLNSFIFLLPRLDRTVTAQDHVTSWSQSLATHLPRPSYRQPLLAPRRLGLG